MLRYSRSHCYYYSKYETYVCILVCKENQTRNYRDIIGDKNVKSMFSQFKNISTIETGQNYP